MSPAKKAAGGDEPAGAQRAKTAAEATPPDDAGASTDATGMNEDAGGQAAGRRRRGSRGGRGRRKPAGQTGEGQTPPETPPEESRTPAAESGAAPARAGRRSAAAAKATPQGRGGEAGAPESQGGARTDAGVEAAGKRQAAYVLPTAPLIPIAAPVADPAGGRPATGGAEPAVTRSGGEAAESADASRPRPRRRGGRGRGKGGSRQEAPVAAVEAGGGPAGVVAAEGVAAAGQAGSAVERAGAPTTAPERRAKAGAGEATEPQETGASRRRPSRRSGAAARPDTSAGAGQAVEVSGASDDGGQAASAAPAAADGVAPVTAEGGPGTEQAADGTTTRRRHRGSRGGRRRRKAADIAHDEVVREAEEAVSEDQPPADAQAPDQDMQAEAGQPAAEGAPKRRRRSPRKRGADQAGEESQAGASAEAGTAVAPPKATATETARPVRSRQRDRRRPKAIVRQDEGSGLDTQASIAMSRKVEVDVEAPKRKIILVSDDGHELRVALVEDGRLAEIYIERPDKKSYLGDIYQGKVENVLGGIDAAFVDFGLEKNGFLYVDEVTTPEGEKRARRIGDALKAGQEVLVQVTKDPMGSKGARLSTKISLAGRYLVYVPGGSGVGVSRRLGQGERDRLRDVCKQLKPKNAGLIVRTIAEGHGLEDLKRDMQYLSRLWTRLRKKSETVKAPGLVHKEVDISIEVARDLFNDTCESFIVDDPKRHKAVVSFLDKEAPELLPKVHQHTGAEPLFEAYGIEDQIAKALERRVPLPSGGNLMIDHAEALTVIDVNTGRFTRGKGLEDTITKTNLEAAHEVVRQLRLRDIGGIIIIDFIDMAHAANREMVLATLEAQLETDRTKTYVVELSPLGLVEMTRQNTTDGARGIMTRACPCCSGKGRVLSEETMALAVERRVRALARKSQAKAWLIEVNGAVAERLSGPRLKKLEKIAGRRVFFEGASSLPVDTFRVIAEGSLAHVQEQRVPLKEGQEVELELEFSLTYSPRDAVGYIDGYMVIVEGGRQHLGQRRKVRITGTARTGAHATVLKQASN